MEKNVNLIIDIEPGEAEVLIEFIENIIDLTYVERHNCDQLLGKINIMGSEKKMQKEKKQ